MTGLAAAQQVLAQWWFNYDEGNFDVLSNLLAPDIHFTSRSDTGDAVYEDFIRADIRGRGDVLAWQMDHRRKSPYPLRHNGTNVHVTNSGEDEIGFASYLFVTQIVDHTVANLSTGICSGRISNASGSPQLVELNVVLDTQNSEVFSLRDRDGATGV
jgi:hypothetical protein